MEEKKQTTIKAPHIAVLFAGCLLGAILMATFQGISERKYMGKFIRAKVDLMEVSEIIKRKSEFKTEEEWAGELDRMQHYISENYYPTLKEQKP